MVTRQVMASGEKPVLEHQTPQRVLHSRHQSGISQLGCDFPANLLQIFQPARMIEPGAWLCGVVALTRKSPPHSCKQCRTSSWLVPPPRSTLVQAMLIKWATDWAGTQGGETKKEGQVEKNKRGGGV